MREECPNRCGWVWDPDGEVEEDVPDFVVNAEHESVCPKNPEVQAKRWANYAVPGDAVHTVPLGDGVQHYLSDGCICGPTAELVPMVHGPDGWLATHHALDGRA